MCGVAKWKRDAREGFSLDECKSMLNSMRLRPGDAVEFSGGEPTIYKNFSELVRYTKETFGARVVVLSHGRTLKSKRFVESIVNSGIDRFVIPLFSDDPEIHDKITQVPGSFRETTQGFRNLADCGIDFSVKFIAMKPNYKHALGTYRYKLEHHPKARFIVSGYQLMGEAIANSTVVGLRHSLVGPEIHKVLELAEQQGEIVPVFMFPMCHLDPSFWHHYGVGVWHEEVLAPDSRKINLSTELNYEDKHPTCKTCIVQEKCVWAWRRYVQEFGAEDLIPFR